MQQGYIFQACLDLISETVFWRLLSSGCFPLKLKMIPKRQSLTILMFSVYVIQKNENCKQNYIRQNTITESLYVFPLLVLPVEDMLELFPDFCAFMLACMIGEFVFMSNYYASTYYEFVCMYDSFLILLGFSMLSKNPYAKISLRLVSSLVSSLCHDSSTPTLRFFHQL